MPETERAILTYEVLSSLDKGINELKEDMRYVKKCADEGKLNDNDAENAIKKAQASGDEGSEVVSLHTLDCSLCATGYAPPPIVQWHVEPVQPLAHVLQSIPAAHIASLTAAPPPGRGPPAFS